MSLLNKQISKKLIPEYADQFKAVKARQFGLPKRQVGTNKWAFRRLITNVMVSGSNEDNVITAAEQIFKEYPTIKDLAIATKSPIVEIMNANHVRFSGRKADNIIDIAVKLITDHAGEVPADFKVLQALPGVGRHTSSTVRSLAFNMSDFGVDLHVRRIAKRIGLVGEKANDIDIEKELIKNVPKEQLAAYSRAFVDFGKETCGADPDCANCFIKNQCNFGSGIKQAPVSKSKITLKDGTFGVVAGSSDREYIVTVKGSKVSCNCKGYRFKKTCSHVKEIVEAV